MVASALTALYTELSSIPALVITGNIPEADSIVLKIPYSFEPPFVDSTTVSSFYCFQFR
jgi:hypothetical protein